MKEFIEHELQLKLQSGLRTHVVQNVLKFGKPYTGIARPKYYRRQWEMKMCYRNAAMVACRKPFEVAPAATYAEGFAVSKSGGWLIQHAWVTLDGMHAVDPTWKNAEEHDYFGVAVPHKTLYQRLMMNKHYFGPILEQEDFEPVEGPRP